MLTLADNGKRLRLQSTEPDNNTVFVGDLGVTWPSGYVVEVLSLCQNGLLNIQAAMGATLNSIDLERQAIHCHQTARIMRLEDGTWEWQLLAGLDVPHAVIAQDGEVMIRDSKYRDGFRWGHNGPRFTDELPENPDNPTANLWFDELRVLNTPLPAPPDPTVSDRIGQFDAIGAAFFQLQAQIDNLPTGAVVLLDVTASRTLADSDNGKTLCCTTDGIVLTLNSAALTTTIGFNVIIQPKGTTSVVCAGGTTINDDTATIVREQAWAPAFSIQSKNVANQFVSP
jgi:hypothetical protein